MKKFYVIVLIFLSCSTSETLSSPKTNKKLHKTTTEATATTTSQPAIIAIEIVDPNENSTSAKQSKRTIDSSLGYGYNSFEASKPRYEVYKYSQHDIPPYKGDASKVFESSLNNNPVNIQKSVQHSLPSVSQHVSASSNILQPGTTLYSSLNGKGHVGSLSASLPEAPRFENGNVPVPVVVLRIYPHQLKDSTIQAKLPKSHPYAKSINSLNIQTLLLKYIKTLKNPGTLGQYSLHQSGGRNYGLKNQYSTQSGSYVQSHGSGNQYSGIRGSLGNTAGFSSQYLSNDKSIGQYFESSNKYHTNQASVGKNKGYNSHYLRNQGSSGRNTYGSNTGYSLPISSSVKPAQASYQTSNYNPDSYQPVPTYKSNNAGSQNYMYYQHSYPQQSAHEYTMQTQYQQQQPQPQPQHYPNYDSGVTVVEAPVKYEITPMQVGTQWRYQTSTIQKPQTTKTLVPKPEPNYYYVQPNAQTSYSTESSQYYQPTQQPEYIKPLVETVPVPLQQYYTENEEPQYSEYYQDDGQQYEGNHQKLLTFENYPTTKHTRVVFKTNSGAIRTPEPEQPPTKDIKTIKIHVPENIAKVELQESERPYYAPEAAAYTDTQQQTKEQLSETYEQSSGSKKEDPQNSYYLPPTVDSQSYYNNENSASEVLYNYQNANLEDMAKYFEKRGAMPKYFFQSSQDSDEELESTTEMPKEIKDLISTYEEAAFPSTTSSPVKKKVKSKKRIPM